MKKMTISSLQALFVVARNEQMATRLSGYVARYYYYCYFYYCYFVIAMAGSALFD